MSFKQKNIPSYTPLVIILSFIVYCIEIDLAVPSFPFITTALHTTEALMQLTLSLNFLGFCLGALVYGPVSDSFGRRTTILIGCSIYVLGGIGCAAMNCIESLLAFRFIQGLGASSGCVVLYAMIADIYPPKKMAWFHGVMNAILTITMAGAPIAGSLINQSFGWRYPLITIAALSILTLIMMLVILPETHHKRPKWNLSKVKGDYLRLFAHKEFMMLTLGPSILVGAYLTFVGTASFFYQNQLKLSIVEFGIHQGLVLTAFSLVSVFTGKLNQTLGIRKSVHYGNAVTLIGAFVLFGLGLYPVFFPYALTFFMCVLVMGIALSFGTTVAIAFSAVPDAVGASSSIIMSSRLFFSSAMVALASKFYDGTWISVANILLVGSVVGCVMINLGIKNSKAVLED